LEVNIQPENLKSVEFIKRNWFVCEGLAQNYLFIDGKWRDHWHFVKRNDAWLP
jgi:ribosomal-protein-alanine N-acetyltransferase